MSKPVIDEEAKAKRAARAEAKHKSALSAKAFLERFASYTERGTALAVVAYLDVKVAAFVKNFFVADTNAVNTMLRVEGGALGSLGSRIRLCYLLGFLEKRIYEDLVSISEIRNIFAHNIDANNFAFPQVQTLCCRLRIFDNPQDFFGGIDGGAQQMEFYAATGHSINEHRWGFVAAVGFLANQFQINQHHAQAIKHNFIKTLF